MKLEVETANEILLIWFKVRLTLSFIRMNNLLIFCCYHSHSISKSVDNYWRHSNNSKASQISSSPSLFLSMNESLNSQVFSLLDQRVSYFICWLYRLNVKCQWHSQQLTVPPHNISGEECIPHSIVSRSLFQLSSENHEVGSGVNR